MKQCFGYVRVSTKKQSEGVSLEAQKEAITQFACKNSIKIGRWFEEQQTAAKSGRPVFNAMVRALKQGQADGVVMHRIDRSARNFFDWAKIGELSDAGYAIHYAAESLDFSSRGGRLTANIQMAVAEDYVRNLKIEIHKGQREHLRNGYYPFTAPVGYVDNGKGKLKTPHPIQGPLVRAAFELYDSGQHSIRTLHQEMVKRGLRSKRGNPIAKAGIEAILNNPFYTGTIHIRARDEVYKGRHKPLISAALFQRVQDRKAGRNIKKVTRHNYTYRCLFPCGVCGKSLIAECQKGYIYYRCHTYECRGNCVREEKLEEQIGKVVGQAAFSKKDVEAIQTAVLAWFLKTDGSNHINAPQMQLKTLEQKLIRIDDAAIDGIIDKDTHAKRKKAALLEKATLEEQIQKAENNHLKPAMVGKFLERVSNLAQHYINAANAEKRLLCELVTSNRKVTAKSVYLEPANWLVAAKNVLGVSPCADDRPSCRRLPETKKSKLSTSCAPDRPTSRRLTDFKNQQLEELTKLARSPELAKIETVFADEDKPHTMKR